MSTIRPIYIVCVYDETVIESLCGEGVNMGIADEVLENHNKRPPGKVSPGGLEPFRS